MKNGNLNVFNSYLSKTSSHEDHLTRAFLALLRSVKLVEAAFLEFVIDQMQQAGISNLPSTLTNSAGGLISVETQVHSSTEARLANESGRLVSLIITDEKISIDGNIERTERTAIYDGLLRFRPDWIFVLENKPNNLNVWDKQLSAAFNESYEIEPIPVVLTWSGLIARLTLLVSNGLVQDTSRILVEDFLAFVDHLYPVLNPYDNFSLCKGNDRLLTRRCVAIMEATALGPVEYHYGWHNSIRLTDVPGVQQIALYPTIKPDGSWMITLAIHPGDTMTQARMLYKNINALGVQTLIKDGWKVSANFHLSFRSSNLVWATTTCSIDCYITYWQDIVSRGKLRQIGKHDLALQLGKWEKTGSISIADVAQFGEALLSKNMQKFNVCPGLSFLYEWRSDNAIELDNRLSHAFVSEVKQKVADALASWADHSV